MTAPHAEATGARAPDTEWARREPFRSLARGGADILAVVDRDSTVRWVSPWVTLLLGHAPEDLIGRRGFDFVHPDDRVRVADRFVNPERGPRPSRPLGLRFHARDGSWRYLEVIITNRLGTPEINGVVVNARSIPEPAIAEPPREGEDPFRWFASSAPIGILFADVNGNATYVNRRWLEITGMSANDARGWCWLAATHPDDRDMVIHLALDAFESDGRSEIVHRVRRPSGEVLWVHERSSGVIGPQGVAVGYTISIEDVTAEHEARAEAERLSLVLERSSDFVTIIDVSGRLLYANDTVRRFFGVEAGADLRRLPPGLGFSEDSTRTLAEDARPALACDGQWTGSLTLIAFDGSEVPILQSSRVHYDENGKPLFVSGVGRDIGELKAVEQELSRREEQFRSLVQRSYDLVAVIDQDGRFRYASPSHARVLGYEPDELIGVVCTDLVHSDDVNRVTSAFAAQFLEGAPTAPVEFRQRHAAGHWVHIEAVASTLRNDSGVGTFVVNARDVSDRHRAQTIAADQAAVLERVARGAPLHETLDAIASMVERWSRGSAAVGLIAQANGSLHIAAAPSLSAVCVDAIEGMPARPRASFAIDGPPHLRRVYVDEIATDDRYPAVRDLLLREGFRAWAAVLIRDTGTRRPLGALIELRPELEAPNEPEASLLEVAADLAAIAVERARAEERLAHQALHDPLTGLPNRALVVERLRHVTGRRSAGTGAVMFLDLDRFKLLNDSLGHDAGDQLLIELGRRLRAELRPSDLVARFGGDEFVIVCEQLDDHRAAGQVAQRILEVVQQPFDVGSSHVVVTASIGIAHADGADADSLLRDADAAMYLAKERGRARVELFDERLRTQAVERLDLERGLRSALSLGQLAVYYQPALSLHSGDVVGFEALLRWRHPELGLLEPERFIGVAEETGLIKAIGRWVVEETCRQAVGWRAAHPEWGPLTFGVNLSAGQITDRTFSDTVERVNEATGMNPGLLSFEITESALVEDTVAAERALRALRAHGVHLALDDFGTGYSSLAHLKRFPIQMLKIDRSFVDGLLFEPDDEAIVVSVVHLARMLGLLTAAEGVEKQEQADRLRELGCDLAQGNLWSAPLPSDEIEALFAGKRAPLRPPDAVS